MLAMITLFSKSRLKISFVICSLAVCNTTHGWSMPRGSAVMLAATVYWAPQTLNHSGDNSWTKESLDASISEVIDSISDNLESSSDQGSTTQTFASTARLSELPSESSPGSEVRKSDNVSCQPGATGVECRTCGTIDGGTSTSTLGMLTCMGLFFAWKLWHRFGF